MVVLSGGLDSTVCLALAASSSPRPPLALTFDYGQRHRIELERAGAVAAHYGCEHLVVGLDTRPWGGSALTDASLDVPPAAPTEQAGDAIPITYVPARNIIFLAVALGVAEARSSPSVTIGVNALDYSGYPDCRPEFIEAFRQVARVGQKRGVQGHPVEILTPLIDRTKAEIALLGHDLGAPLGLTWSCYREGPEPCGDCDACALRAKGFARAGLADPAATGSRTDPLSPSSASG
ncbi:MAG: 7-cyano-7-deazaguanine synthase QueC [Acidimicrobiales bacterium]